MADTGRSLCYNGPRLVLKEQGNEGKSMGQVCPHCGKKLESIPEGIAPGGITARNPYFPFCCNRCQMADLYGWLEERYRIPAVEQDSESGNNDPIIDSNADASEES
jgi:endogenous inhibitor of DNA gyrase (YacG/DUF329 family)